MLWDYRKQVLPDEPRNRGDWNKISFKQWLLVVLLPILALLVILFLFNKLF